MLIRSIRLEGNGPATTGLGLIEFALLPQDVPQIAICFGVIGIEFQGPSTSIRMALGKGHQGIAETAYATYRFNKQEGKPDLADLVYYPAECVNPPEGVTAVAWLEGGMKGAKCN